GAGNVTVNVSLPYRLSGGVVFSHLKDNVNSQRLVLGGTLDRVATARAEISIAAPTATSTVPVAPTVAPPPNETPTAGQPTPSATAAPPHPPHPTQPPRLTPTAEQPMPTAEQPAGAAATESAATPAPPQAPPAGGAPAGAAQRPQQL